MAVGDHEGPQLSPAIGPREEAEEQEQEQEDEERGSHGGSPGLPAALPRPAGPAPPLRGGEQGWRVGRSCCVTNKQTTNK